MKNKTKLCLVRKITWVIPIILLLISALSVCFSEFLYCDIANATRGITDRDYIAERVIDFEGTGAVVGTEYTLSLTNSLWPKRITFDMSGIRALLVLIEHEETPSSIVVLGSEPSSPRILKVIWAHDDLKTPVSFWTSDYWKPDKNCDSTGCPKIRFQVIEGGAAVTILGKRKH
ncbi:hypothetical protein QUF90_19520 [Desulfococcaceae bacterium HSG9]|nr:hypothetical protein [Desulfococcaceae bacterium HSG9]